ncbi:MAG: ABC transporter ATP-binding protein/permease [Chlorobium sp.]|uniref:ABC transporter ATP-binding protein n=1 Tax=Chlorobium sp. TaxID=1095 RepID=UPI0025C06ED3|nr:ABC transporter ATP-binding protein [Chlorobium sp.]MCF8215340.1 ABC transporter ATP-binding protein/permease [Chlorobium sp.]MCF8270177.1 ABC transporter ATP-binding protein/permease [Chlorobium sp.]MCF8286547.1 ABC transporter ATP-binding protein/permease [Chlorobium sp.]MCF8290145.1 ABC transporter ATP-binding protein/permease [Chlorobium sp.]MCF8384304.1 ABC transporter ATP-binding protein/permease [Chlorobium sp.]
MSTVPGTAKSFNPQQDETLKKKKGSIDLYIVSKLLAYIKPYRGLVSTAIIITLAGSIFGPLRPYLTKVAIDDNILKNDLQGLILTSILLVGVILLDGIKQYATTWITQIIGQKAVFDIRMDVFSHMQKLPARFFDRNPIGRLITRTTNDVESLNEMLSSGVISILGDISQLFFIVVLMFWLDWQLTLIVLGVLPLMLYTTFSFKNRVRAAFMDVRTHLASLNSFFQEHIAGVNIVQLFSRESREFSTYAAINADHRDANIRTVFYFSLYYPAIELISSIAAGLVIWYSGVRLLKAELSIGVVISFVQYIWLFFRPLQHLSDKFNIIQTAITSSNRIFRLLEEPVEQESPDNAPNTATFADRMLLRNVWFAYDDENWVLRDLSLEIRHGEKIAIVGATGSGKTTIINILSGLYPYGRGSVQIDGVELRDIPVQDLRRLIGVVMQDVILFSGTLRENLAFGNPGISDNAIAEAARIVGADRFISQLPGGYSYKVKENGTGLSAGQKQLIAFVRALLYNPQVLVLDEATSSVDTETEQLIEAATDELMDGRTSIMIAHRLSTIQKADRIIVLHKGKIREIGSHQELLAEKGLYYKLYLLQHPAEKQEEKA